MADARYLIGQGEKLSEEIARPPRGMGDKAHPYTFDKARSRLAPQIRRAVDELDSLPELALPGGRGVLEMTLHPSYLAKSFYPGSLMRELGLEHLGSRAVHVTPSVVVSQRAKEAGKSEPAAMLYVAGELDLLKNFSSAVATWRPRTDGIADDFRKIETISAPSASRQKRISESYRRDDGIPLEVVLHSPLGDRTIVPAFQNYLHSLGIRIDIDRRRQAGGLCFLPMRAAREVLDEILQFTFLRALREMPKIVPFDPVLRVGGADFLMPITPSPAVASDLAVAIFDGGLPSNHGLDQWVDLHDAPGVGAPLAAAQSHGLAVTSAFLFGPVSQGSDHATPYANVDHWRIVGDDLRRDDFEAFSLLNRIESVLTSRRYDFVNISLGPACTIDDDDVSVWTSTLDKLLANGETVATVACGNNGEEDQGAGLHRVQPPSDGVNMLAVGASDRHGDGWARASYSACGPGRSPGFVKPDFLTFGGSAAAPFLLLTEVSPHRAGGRTGTSFAAPLAMRSGAGIRAQFTEPLWAPTVKALLVHHADRGDHSASEVGWGSVSHHVGDLVLCGDHEAHVVYQRAMPESGAVRLYLPIPDGMTGNVEIKATFCFYCDVDPEDAINYTRAGLEIQFRPDTTRIPPPYKKNGKTIAPTMPATDTFFSSADFYASENMKRGDAQKWETTLSRTKKKRASSLVQPAFDVSQITREHGHAGARSANMKVALVLTIRNRQMANLYDQVVVSSRNRLQPMRARTGVTVPVRTRR